MQLLKDHNLVHNNEGAIHIFWSYPYSFVIVCISSNLLRRNLTKFLVLLHAFPAKFLSFFLFFNDKGLGLVLDGKTIFCHIYTRILLN